MMTIKAITSIANWCMNFIAALIFLSILLTALKYRQRSIDISVLLAYNASLAALLSSVTVCVMLTSNLSNSFLTFNHDFCVFWGFLYNSFICSVYHSYCLQAFYRLFRVVFYKKKSLLKRSVFLLFILTQWLCTFLVLLPPIFCNWYIHLSTDSYCLVPYTNLLTETYHISVIYMTPMVCIITVYIWITRFIREHSRTTSVTLSANQRKRNLRDLTMTKRLVVLISILIVLRFPTIIFMVFAVINGYLYTYAYVIVGLITSVCMIFIGFIMIYITPHLRKNFLVFIYPNNQVNPEQTLEQHSAAATGGLNRINHFQYPKN